MAQNQQSFRLLKKDKKQLQKYLSHKNKESRISSILSKNNTNKNYVYNFLKVKILITTRIITSTKLQNFELYRILGIVPFVATPLKGRFFEFSQ